MEYNWNEIKKEIIAETKEIISQEKAINVQQIVDLFSQVLTFKIDDVDLDGIESRIPNALQKILLDPISRLDKNAYFPEVAKIEQYLRKILSLTNKNLYNQIKLNKEGLAPLISYLELNPNNVNYSWVNLSQSQSTHFALHLMKAYNLRNLESHQCKEWTNARLYDELRSVLIIYLYATYKHYNRLKIAVNPFDVTDYLKKEIQRVKSWQSRFVHIEGKENFNEIDLYAKEYFEEPCEIEDEGKENFSTNDKIIREGTIDHLRKSIEEKQMVIIGEVGMGKSTTLQYLLLKDAEESLKDSSKPTPIYFELKNLTEKDDLLKKIKERLGIDMDLVKDIMKRGALNLFFDGLNEIEKKVKAAVFSQIINMLNDYPNNSFIITCRPIHYNREFDNLMLNRKIPVFILQKMHDKQIEEFLDKNGKQVKQYILKEISNHDRLKRIIQTPLLLTMLIAVVIKEGSIPNEKGKIIRAFMNSLYDREQRVFIDFDKETFHLMLCYLGFQSRDLTGSNSGLDRDEYILPILEVRKLQLGLSINLLEFLKKSLELNVLVLEDNMYSFSHELYQEYYAAEYLHQLTKN